jgi:hypothetical protein
MIRKVFNKLFKLKRGVNTLFRKSLGKSDYSRWTTKDELSPSWDSRTKQIANLVESGDSVIEFGAGRLILKDQLPEKCSYTPSDLVDRGNGTIICDLNCEILPELQTYDVAVFSGVLEYVNDVARLISFLSDRVNVILASYAVTDTKLIDNRNRRMHGWVNDYSSEELIAIFENAGFHREHTEQWQSQMIYKFTKK